MSTVATRRRIPTKERLAIFSREQGRCHLCQGLVQVGEAWDISHDTPLELGGEDHGENLKVAHRKCHRAHTAKVDVPIIRKAQRREARHLGATAPAARKITSRGFPMSEKQKKDPDPFPNLPRGGNLMRRGAVPATERVELRVPPAKEKPKAAAAATRKPAKKKRA